MFVSPNPILSDDNISKYVFGVDLSPPIWMISLFWFWMQLDIWHTAKHSCHGECDAQLIVPFKGHMAASKSL